MAQEGQEKILIAVPGAVLIGVSEGGVVRGFGKPEVS
jgi:hypothetical protein